MLKSKYTVNSYKIELNPIFNIWNITKDGNTFGSYRKFSQAFKEAKNG